MSKADANFPKPLSNEKAGAHRAQEPASGAAPPEKPALVQELARLEERLAELEAENQDLSAKYVRITQQNESLTNLYVASHQLHSTLDPQEVLRIVNEILTNLIGAEEFTVLLVDKATKELTPVTGGGPPRGSGESRWEESILGRVIETGEAFFRNEENPLPGQPLACVPLTIKQDVVGVIVIDKLLVQKEGFTPMDSDILNLLAGHAATAVVASHLYADAERKLKTIKGFMKLLLHRDPQAEIAIPQVGGSGA